MFEAIYYLSTIVFIVKSLFWIHNPLKQTAEEKQQDEIYDLFKEQFKGKKYADYSDEYKAYMLPKIYFMIFSTTWFFLGIFNFQWPLYILRVLFNVIIINPLLKITKYSLLYSLIRWINSIISIVFNLFLIINNYNLKINIAELILKLINK